MRTIRLNHQRQHSSSLLRLRYLLMMIGILLLAASWSQKMQLERKLAAIHWQQQNMGRQLAGSKPTRQLADTQQAEQDKYAANIMATLNTPWNNLFTAIEQAYSKQLVLSTVLPNPQQKTVVIEGLATEISQAIDFTERLKKTGVLDETHLTLEDVDEVNQYFPQQFQINARWRPDHE